jgi:flagellar basal-body rod protein FlgB
MAISFDSAIGFHEKALHFRAQRAEVLASNLVNVDTPNFKARDIDFSSVMKAQQSGRSMSTTHGRHINAASTGMSNELMYRTPMQPSLDGNTVDEQAELARFAKNSLDFQASFKILNGTLKAMRSAIRGE